MNPSLRLRLLTRADLQFADSLRELNGWNQTTSDWERFVALEPDGCFLAEWNGIPAGTATTRIYGSQLAWIGMVLVHPNFRRHGIGRALLNRCIEHLQNRAVRCIKLDATPLGKKVYDSLGFKEEWALTRWLGQPRQGAMPLSQSTSAGLRSLTKADIAAVTSLDTTAFGVSRLKLLQLLPEQNHAALVAQKETGQVMGYGMLRRGAQALYLGPVVATSQESASQIIDELLRRGRGHKIIWDIPDQNVAAMDWARNHGFTAQRSLTRMFLGDNSTPGDPQKQFAIAGPEIG